MYSQSDFNSVFSKRRPKAERYELGDFTITSDNQLRGLFSYNQLYGTELLQFLNSEKPTPCGHAECVPRFFMHEGKLQDLADFTMFKDHELASMSWTARKGSIVVKTMSNTCMVGVIL